MLVVCGAQIGVFHVEKKAYSVVTRAVHLEINANRQFHTRVLSTVEKAVSISITKSTHVIETETNGECNCSFDPGKHT